jgi:hypothetical protein
MDLAGETAFAEISQLQRETAEAPPAAVFPVSGKASFSFAPESALCVAPSVSSPDMAASETECNKVTDTERTVQSLPRKAFQQGVAHETRVVPSISERDAYAQLGEGVSEAVLKFGDPAREDVAEVPGAFVLRNVLGGNACAKLCRWVDGFVDASKIEKKRKANDARPDGTGKRVHDTTAFSGKTHPGPTPRRESAARRLWRLGHGSVTAMDNDGVTAKEKDSVTADDGANAKSSDTAGISILWQKVCVDPLSLVNATTTPDGVTHAPVEPSRWVVPVDAMTGTYWVFPKSRDCFTSQLVTVVHTSRYTRLTLFVHNESAGRAVSSFPSR